MIKKSYDEVVTAYDKHVAIIQFVHNIENVKSLGAFTMSSACS